MPAYKPGEHQASDSLYSHATSATEAASMSARVITIDSSVARKTASHASRGVKAAVSGTGMKQGLDSWPPASGKSHVSGRLSMFNLKKGFTFNKGLPFKKRFGVKKEVRNSSRSGVTNGVVHAAGRGARTVPGSAATGVIRVNETVMRQDFSSDDEMSRLPGDTVFRVAHLPVRSVKTIRSGGKRLRTARHSLKRARGVVRQIKFARSVVQTGKVIVRMVVSSVSSVGAALLPFVGVIFAAVAAVACIMSFASSQASACTVDPVDVGSFAAPVGKLAGLKTKQMRGVTTVDFQAMGITSTWFDNDASAYQFQQCTWWVANRWKTLGLEVDHHMGNGGQWAASARDRGYPTGSQPRLGAIISMRGGVLGASHGPYGHVAVVEQIDKDGSIWVSESGTSVFARYDAPVVNRYSKAQLDDARGAYTYIYSTGRNPESSDHHDSRSVASFASVGCRVDDGGDTGAASTSAKAAQEYAKKTMRDEYGWGDEQFQALLGLWNKESGWNYKAVNQGSGAYGIPQALPGVKMASKGADWKTNPHTQIDWGLQYIHDRYGSPQQAWRHSQQTNWY